MEKLLTMCVFTFLLSGCATTPPPPSEIKAVPEERLLDFQDQKLGATSTLIITRDEGALGSACYLSLKINNKLAGRFNPAESAKFYIEPGEHLLRVGNDPLGKGLCSFMQNEWTQRETTLRAGEVKTFRISMEPGGKLDIQRSER